MLHNILILFTTSHIGGRWLLLLLKLGYGISAAGPLEIEAALAGTHATMATKTKQIKAGFIFLELIAATKGKWDNKNLKIHYCVLKKIIVKI